MRCRSPICQGYTCIHTVVYNHSMATRTNVVLDEELVERVKKIYGLPTTRAAIDFALRTLVGSSDRRDMLELEGIGWEGDLDAMRPPAPY